MNKRLNFEDNIYVLLSRIRMIRDLLVLDADPSLFMDKTMDDIEFIDNTLGKLLMRLMENQRLIEREELLNHLSELEWQFSQILSEFLNDERSLSVKEFPVFKDKIMILRTHSLERRKMAEKTESGGKTSEEPLVSSNELNELLKSL